MSAKSDDQKPGYYAALEESAGVYPLATEALMRSERHRLRRWRQFIDPMDMLAAERLQAFLAMATRSLAGQPAARAADMLTDRIADDLRACLEAIVSGYLQVASDAMRDVMEAELLIRDFALDPQQIARWVSADERTLRRDFQPFSCRRRLAAALNVTPDNLPGASDYRAHSQVLHVTPLRLFARAPEALGHEAGAVLDQIGEILFHGTSVVEAVNALLTAVGQSPLDSEPVLAVISEAFSNLSGAQAALEAAAEEIASSCGSEPRAVMIFETGLVLVTDLGAGKLDSYRISRTDFRQFGQNIAEDHPLTFELTWLGESPRLDGPST